MSQPLNNLEPGGAQSVRVFDVTLSFSGGGWFQMYHFGVCKAFQDSGVLQKLRSEGRKIRFCGTSAGALAAAKLASGCNLYDEMKEYALECSEAYRMHWIPPLLALKGYVLSGIQRCSERLADPASLEAAKSGMRDGQLELYATVLPWFRTKVFNDLRDREDLIEALCASCTLVPLFGLPFRLRKTGEWVCDGGITAFQPRRGDPNTITISPFYFTDADIRPCSCLRPWRAVYPLDRQRQSSIFDKGYEDCLTFLVREQYLDSEVAATLIQQHEISGGRIHDRHVISTLDVIAHRVVLKLVSLVLVFLFLAELVFAVIRSAVCGRVSEGADIVRWCWAATAANPLVRWVFGPAAQAPHRPGRHHDQPQHDEHRPLHSTIRSVAHHTPLYHRLTQRVDRHQVHCRCRQ